MILNNSLERRVTRSSLRNDNRITTAVFIPKTPNGKLADRLQEQEDHHLKKHSNWTTKILEKPGIQLARLFCKKVDMESGCWRGKECKCEGKGNNCTAKGVVYQATCKTCVDSVSSRAGEI